MIWVSGVCSGLPMLPRLSHLCLLLGAIALVIAVYLGSLDAPFLWDDLELLEQPCVRSLCSPYDYLVAPFWDLGAQSPGKGLLYRPLVTLSLALDQALHGRNPTGFHLTNLFLHLINLGLVAALARRLGANHVAAYTLAVLWSLLPRLCESVAWISGRTDILQAAPALGCLLVWRASSRWRRLGAAALGVVACFAKEAGVGALLAVAVAELCSTGRGARLLRAALPTSLLLGYLALRYSVLGGANQQDSVPLSAWGRLLTVAEAIGRYCWMTLDLWHPRTQMGVVSEPRIGFVVLGAASASILAWLAYRRRGRMDAFALAVLVVAVTPLLMVIHLIALPWVAVVGDRLGYLPWAVGAAALAGWATRQVERLPRVRWWAIGAAVCLVASLIPRTRQRIALFADELEFWIDGVVTTAPSNWGPTLDLAALYLRGGWPERSLAILESLHHRCASPVKLRQPRIAEVSALARMGQYVQAYADFAHEAEPNRPTDLLMLARLRLSLGDVDGAEGDVASALRLYAGYEEARQVEHSIVRLKQVSELLTRSPEGLERSILNAQHDMLSGRLAIAETQWLGLLMRPDCPPSVVDEGFAFLAELASPTVLAQAVTTYRARADGSSILAGAAEQRLSFARRLDVQWSRVEQMLREKNLHTNRCGRVASFSD
jgi:hypothetical protein